MNKTDHRIAIIAGTRPEVIKLIPVYQAMRKSELLKPVFIFTGQHREMVNPLWDLFGISPEIVLEPETGDISVLTSSLFREIATALKESKPTAVVVQGDTTTAMVGAMTAYYHGLPVCHVEAGLRTYNRLSPFPEEVNRQIISRIADIHFTPTARASRNLEHETGLEGVVHMVGNTVVDALQIISNTINERRSVYEDKFQNLDPFPGGLVLITGHRRENVGKRFDDIFNAIAGLAKSHEEIAFVFPVHLNPLVREHVGHRLSGLENVFLTDPLPYDEMLYLMQKSRLIISDSGGIQEEAPSFGTPVIVTRDHTERPEGVEAGFTFLAGADPDRIRSLFINLISESTYREIRPNPYGKGDAAASIVSIIEKETGRWAM